MADFLEERLPELIRMGSSYVDDYQVDVVTSSGGHEYRSLRHPFPVRKFDISYMLDTDTTWKSLQAVYHRAHGKYAGFRARCYDEWSSNGRTGVPTAFDQTCGLVSAGVYQLRKTYGMDKTAGAAGYAYREIKKPVSGTVLVAIGPTAIVNTDWSVDVTTGRITFATDQTFNITGISQAASAVLTLGTHGLNIGQSVQISGVSGMSQINGLRALITAKTATTITVSINSTSFSAYTSGGAVHTRPQTGEIVTAGYEFDFPVRFNSTLPIGQDYPNYRAVDGIELIELLNP